VLKIKYLLPAALLSLTYNFVLLLSVALNLDWVRTRAAGGQYETFPPTLRIIYFVMAAFMITLAMWLWDHRNRALDSKSKKLARILGLTFIFSTMLQLVSRSADERWNAVPAIILAITFYFYSRKDS